MKKRPSKAFLLGLGAAICLLLAAGFHFRYLLMKTELRSGTLILDPRGERSDCHLVDTKRLPDEEWAVKGFGEGKLTEEAVAKMFRVSDGLEASFCEKHPELLNQPIAIRGVRVNGDAIGQDCTNRNCFRWVRVE